MGPDGRLEGRALTHPGCTNVVERGAICHLQINTAAGFHVRYCERQAAPTLKNVGCKLVNLIHQRSTSLPEYTSLTS